LALRWFGKEDKSILRIADDLQREHAISRHRTYRREDDLDDSSAGGTCKVAGPLRRVSCIISTFACLKHRKSLPPLPHIVDLAPERYETVGTPDLFLWGFWIVSS
jgi:hypothetical protein